MMKTIYIKFLFFIFLSFVSFKGFSSCNYDSVSGSPVVNFSFGTITVQRDVPVGTVIGTTQSVHFGDALLNCSGGGGHSYYHMAYLGGSPTGMQHVYATNIPGLGIRVEESAGRFFDNPPTTITYSEDRIVQMGNYPSEFDLIKTSDSLQSGSLLPSLVSEVYGDDRRPVVQYYLTSGIINVLACSVDTPVVNVPLGTYLTSDFTGVNHVTSSQVVPIALDCSIGARVNVVVTANADTSTNQPGAIKINAGGATGVAVQLLNKNGTGVDLNKKFVVDSMNFTGKYDFNWTARYIQTSASVTAGDANASATLSITYE